MEKFNSKLILNEIEKMHFDMCCKNAKFAVISLDHNLLHLALMTHFEENNIFFKINLDTFFKFLFNHKERPILQRFYKNNKLDNLLARKTLPRIIIHSYITTGSLGLLYLQLFDQQFF